MRYCILDSATKVVDNVIIMEPEDVASWRPYRSGIELSPRHDGELGWRLENGEWITNAVVKDATYWAMKVRQRRNILLKKSDIYVLPDYPITAEKLAEWRGYRQSLRDISEQAGFPTQVVWPVKPE